jgi:triosephosphate isomerase
VSPGGGRRRTIVAANWKMNLLTRDATDFCRELRRGLAAPNATSSKPGFEARVALFPPFPLIPVVVRELVESEVEIGGQDLHPSDKGAHTGDVSGHQLRDVGCAWVLCGHSERRRDHHEGDELVARKVEAAERNHLMPMLCCGETREERGRGETFAVLARQVRAALVGRKLPLALAYEPIWAIGTGETAAPAQAQEAHAFLRGELREIFGDAGGGVSILYGGSVTPETAAGLAAQPDLDGFLVGGASLDPQKFLAIIRSSG